MQKLLVFRTMCAPLKETLPTEEALVTLPMNAVNLVTKMKIETHHQLNSCLCFLQEDLELGHVLVDLVSVVFVRSYFLNLILLLIQHYIL